jgi:hypothetical protein
VVVVLALSPGALGVVVATLAVLVAMVLVVTLAAVVVLGMAASMLLLMALAVLAVSSPLAVAVVAATSKRDRAACAPNQREDRGECRETLLHKSKPPWSGRQVASNDALLDLVELKRIPLRPAGAQPRFNRLELLRKSLV